MNKIARFYKVSFGQFQRDWLDSFAASPDEIADIYESIRLSETLKDLGEINYTWKA